ncbi:hypothetical protein RF11_15738 [Thelohanellus kitauei]|uniref:Uncharacterized protein n=1 Tax=Thelohanellus kitauei TaxID=669202 RepID=A0A0C2JEX2_THEKT|nr:hypothetical protein RF11_15738 [Thelohanellus kitauei]
MVNFEDSPKLPNHSMISFILVAASVDVLYEPKMVEQKRCKIFMGLWPDGDTLFLSFTIDKHSALPNISLDYFKTCNIFKKNKAAFSSGWSELCYNPKPIKSKFLEVGHEEDTAVISTTWSRPNLVTYKNDCQEIITKINFKTGKITEGPIRITQNPMYWNLPKDLVKEHPKAPNKFNRTNPS